MEPSRSLDAQIFSQLDQIATRNISATHNPLEISEMAHVDSSKPMDILISQDCGGFNLGSFLLRRSEFTRRVLDMWWDPVFYEQKYLQLPHVS
jgi:mannan polymerase II complex MNN10 subunit